MSVQASPSRPATKSNGAAFVDIVLTLAVLVVGLLSFLIAPLLALGAAYLVYAVLRQRGRRKAGPRGVADRSSHGFGAGTAA
jgi:hypothetical protein